MAGHVPDRYPTRTHLRRAARNLLPVVLDFGPDQPRFLSYLVGLRGTGERAEVRLSPIATRRLPADRTATIRSRDPEEPLAIARARVRVTAEGEAHAALSGATLHRLDRRRRARRMHEHAPMTLLVPAGTDHRDVHAFPVLDLSATHCSIEATDCLTPGDRLDPVELVGDRRTLRRASAVVSEVIPWVGPRGEPRFRCRLALGPCAVASLTGRQDLVSDAQRIRAVVDLAAMSGASARISTATTLHLTGRLLGKEEASVRIDTSAVPGFAESALGSVVQVSFELFGVAYEMTTRATGAQRGTLETTMPLSLRRRRTRQERRVACPPGTVSLSFDNPASGGRASREVVDVSFGGLCFAPAPEDVLWQDLPLERCVLSWQGRRCDLGELILRGVGGDTAHAALASPRASDDPLMIDLLATVGHPDLGVDDGTDFRGILDAYRRSGIFHGYMVRNLEPIAPAAAHAWRTIRKDAPELTRTLVHRQDGEIDATITVLRAWENAWIVQHFGASSADGFRWSGELQMASLDYLVPRPNGRYVFFFVETSNRSMNAFYERFFKLTGTSEAIERSTVELWSLPASVEPRADGSTPWKGRPARRADERVVSRAACRAFGPMTAAALSMVPGELSLPDLARSFRHMSLDRSRQVEVLRTRDASLALLHERCSPGLNLTGKLNATWILPVHVTTAREAEAVGAALLRVEERPPMATLADRFVLLPHGLCTEPLEARGWEHRMTVNTYVLNRAGLIRYHDYVADRYGAADVRARARSASTHGQRSAASTTSASAAASTHRAGGVA